MAYSEDLADRIRAALVVRSDVIEKRMIGGLTFMVGGRMACGVVGDELMARVGPERYEAALAQPHVRRMEFTGRPLRGFVLVGQAALPTQAGLKTWVDGAVAFALTLAVASRAPAAKKKPPTRKKSPPRKKLSAKKATTKKRPATRKPSSWSTSPRRKRSRPVPRG